jgi:hypothetical protein
MNKALRKSVKKACAILPSVSDLVKAAKKGEAKRFWYSNARDSIAREYGPDADIFVALLAATSPRQSVALNLSMTKSIFAAWDLLGRDLSENTLHELGEMGDLGARYGNIRRALLGEQLSGPKVCAFKANLLGDEDKVTIDTWMVTFAGIRHERTVLTKGGIIAYKRRVSKAARILGWTPAQVQAAIWSYCYSYTEGIPVEDVPEFFAADLDKAEIV